jgi:hypothetical protein
MYVRVFFSGCTYGVRVLAVMFCVPGPQSPAVCDSSAALIGNLVSCRELDAAGGACARGGKHRRPDRQRLPGHRAVPAAVFPQRTTVIDHDRVE